MLQLNETVFRPRDQKFVSEFAGTAETLLTAAVKKVRNMQAAFFVGSGSRAGWRECGILICDSFIPFFPAGADRVRSGS